MDLPDTREVTNGIHLFPQSQMHLDFDHIDNDKEKEISRAIQLGWSKEHLLSEIEKCDLVCAVCHRIRTHIKRKDEKKRNPDSS